MYKPHEAIVPPLHHYITVKSDSHANKTNTQSLYYADK